MNRGILDYSFDQSSFTFGLGEGRKVIGVFYYVNFRRLLVTYSDSYVIDILWYGVMPSI